MLNKNLMSYIPIFVEWENEEISTFANKSFMRAVLKEFHSPDEYSK